MAKTSGATKQPILVVLQSTTLERWLKLEAKPIVNGSFEQLGFL